MFRKPKSNCNIKEIVFFKLIHHPKEYSGIQLVGINDLERSVLGAGLAAGGRLWEVNEKGCHL